MGCSAVSSSSVLVGLSRIHRDRIEQNGESRIKESRQGLAAERRRSIGTERMPKPLRVKLLALESALTFAETRKRQRERREMREHEGSTTNGGVQPVCLSIRLLLTVV